MQSSRAVFAVILSLAAALPAAAATVEVRSGDVFIDSGSGFSPVLEPTEVKTGDTVMAMVGGAAEIVYNDGCRQTVDVGSLVVIGEASPCSGTAESGPVNNTLLIGGLVVVGGVGAAIALSGGGSDKPASN